MALRLEHICAACKRPQGEHIIEDRNTTLAFVSTAFGTVCVELDKWGAEK